MQKLQPKINLPHEPSLRVKRGHAQLEKEAFSLIFGVKKFHQFFIRTSFTLVTDHKPLRTILCQKIGLPTLATARIQRWALVMPAYQYNIDFQSTKKHLNTNGHSRLPL